jgi:hypothetical protein
MQEWEKVTSVNGFQLSTRPSIRDRLLCPWIVASGGKQDCTGTLDIDLAPFRLLAIVNRIDLRNSGAKGVVGQGRLVFAALDRPGRDPIHGGSPLPFTVIFEYGLPAKGGDAKAWATRWHALGKLPCSSTQNCTRYLTALEQLTAAFTTRGRLPGAPQGNPLQQIRSNEIALGSPWELREFALGFRDGRPALLQRAVAQSPDPTLNRSVELGTWANQHADEIRAGTHQVPAGFLGAHALSSFKTEFRLDLPDVPEDVRFGLSSQTCNGCHREEQDKIASVDGFYHISPLKPAGLPRLSQFVRGTEFARRADDLMSLLIASPMERDHLPSNAGSRVH